MNPSMSELSYSTDGIDSSQWLQKPKADTAARLLSFQIWLCEQFDTHLAWPPNPRQRQHQHHQCKIFVLESIREMAKNGFLLDGENLATLLTTKIKAIADLQRRGKISDLYPYFRTVWRNFVRQELEQLRDTTMAIGHHITNLSASIKVDDTLPAIIDRYYNECLTRKLKVQRKAIHRHTAEKRQLPLFPPSS